MAITTERFEKVDIDKLIPYARNARTHSKKQVLELRASIREFGFINPVIIDKEFNIIAGHGRIMAAKEEGLKELPCVFAEHLTDAQKKAYILADNRLAMNAGWDEEMLAVELSELEGADFDLSLLGFDEAELNQLLHDEESIQDDDFDLDKTLDEEPIAKLGDLWKLGEHRLLCGDSTNEEDVTRLMNGKKANLLLTDPPYAIGYESKAGTIKNDNLNDEDMYTFIFNVFTNGLKAIANDASAYVFHADTKGEIFRRAFRESGFHLSGCLVWKKSTFTIGRSPYQWGHEPALYGWPKKGKHQWYAGRKESTVWEFDKPKNNDIHPTIKPIPMLAYAIRNSTLSGCIVLDLFSGSFSTGIACHQTDRICYAMELDEKYASASIKRFAESYGYENITVERDGKIYRYNEVASNE